MRKPFPCSIACLVCSAIAFAAGIATHTLLIDDRPAGASFRESALGHLARLDAIAEPGQAVFLGSSTFQALDVGSVTDKALNLGLGGDTIDGLIDRMAGYRSPALSRMILLNIGFNDLMRGRNATQLRYQELMDALPVEKPLIVLGLQQVRRESPERQEELNRGVVAANDRLSKLCSVRPACRFVENPADGSSAGRQLLGPDGIHLSAEGYAELRARLRQALARSGGDARHER